MWVEREGHSSTRDGNRKENYDNWSDKVERLIDARKMVIGSYKEQGREERRKVYWSNFGAITEE